MLCVAAQNAGSTPGFLAARQERNLESWVHGLHDDGVVEHARGVLVQRHNMEPERREGAVLLRREVPATQGAEEIPKSLFLLPKIPCILYPRFCMIALKQRGMTVTASHGTSHTHPTMRSAKARVGIHSQPALQNH